MTTARLVRAMIECHLSAVKILQTAVADIEREGESERRKSDVQVQQTAIPSASATVQKRLLTSKEAAAILGLSHRTLDTLRVRGGGPPFVRLQRRAIRYDRGELEGWAAAHQRYTSTTHADSLCSVKEACAILNIGVTKIYQLIDEKQLPIVKIGRSTRIRRSDLDRIVHLGDAWKPETRGAEPNRRVGLDDPDGLNERDNAGTV